MIGARGTVNGTCSAPGPAAVIAGSPNDEDTRDDRFLAIAQHVSLVETSPVPTPLPVNRAELPYDLLNPFLEARTSLSSCFLPLRRPIHEPLLRFKSLPRVWSPNRL